MCFGSTVFGFTLLMLLAVIGKANTQVVRELAFELKGMLILYLGGTANLPHQPSCWE